MTRAANFCAQCGQALISRWHSGRERPYCLACESPVFFEPKVAAVVLIQRDDRLLLIQRALDPGKGKWALPAGFVDHDETPEAAAIRETLEETRLQIRIKKLLAVYGERGAGLADISIAYSAAVVAGVASAGDDAADLGWFARSQLPPLVDFPSKALILAWRDGKLDL